MSSPGVSQKIKRRYDVSYVMEPILNWLLFLGEEDFDILINNTWSISSKRQVRAGEVGAREVGGDGEVGEVGAGEVKAGEVGTGEARAGGVGEVRARESRTGKTGGREVSIGDNAVRASEKPPSFSSLKLDSSWLYLSNCAKGLLVAA
jgi:hypothetical protein